MLQEIVKHYKDLSPDEQKLVSAKRFRAVDAPTAMLETLAGVQQYAQKLAKMHPRHEPKFSKAKVQKALPYTLILLPVYFVMWLFAEDFLPVLWWGCAAGLGVLALLWLFLDLIPQTNLRQLTIKPAVFDLVVPLLLLLQDELKPNEQLSLRLDLRESNQRKFYYKTHKNYVLMLHRLIIRWIPLGFSMYALGRLFDIFPKLINDGFLILGFFLTLLFSPFILLLASFVFGKSPKIKTVIRQAPKVDLKAKLTDDTLLQVQVHHMSLFTTSVKKKVKMKDYQIAKTKKKHKSKTVTTVKLAFSQKQYPLSKEALIARFSKKPRIYGRTIAKVKHKPGSKRNTIVYTDIVTKQGAGHQGLQYTMPSFEWLVKLIMEGGYYPLKGLGESTNNKTESKSVPLDANRDNLTAISGVGRATEAKLYGAGILTFAQLADMSKVEFREMLRGVGINPKQANDWQKQARELM